MRKNIEKIVGEIRREFHKRGFAQQLHQVIKKLKEAMAVTHGYQDSEGFHLGVERAIIKTRSRRKNKS